MVFCFITQNAQRSYNFDKIIKHYNMRRKAICWLIERILFPCFVFKSLPRCSPRVDRWHTMNCTSPPSPFTCRPIFGDKNGRFLIEERHRDMFDLGDMLTVYILHVPVLRTCHCGRTPSTGRTFSTQSQPWSFYMSAVLVTRRSRRVECHLLKIDPISVDL